MAHLKINNPSKGSVSAACRKQPVIRLRGLDRLPNNLELRPKVGLFFLKIKHPSKRTWFGFGFLYIYIYHHPRKLIITRVWYATIIPCHSGRPHEFPSTNRLCSEQVAVETFKVERVIPYPERWSSGRKWLFIFMPKANSGRPLSVVKVSAFMQM